MDRILASQVTLHKLEVFCMVCELESVTRVADRMRVAQPVVTAHIRFLEEKLGVKLFEKNGRRLALTMAGRRVYQWAGDIITRTRELERELDLVYEGGAGRAVIAASMTVASYVLPPLLARFCNGRGEGSITVQVYNPMLVTSSIHDGSCDFGVTILDSRQDIDGLIVKQLWTEQLVLVAATANRTIPDIATIADIGRLPFISSPRGQTRRELEEEALRAAGVTNRHVLLEFGHGEAMKQAVCSGPGVAFMLETSVRDELKTGRLRLIKTPGLEMPISVFMLHRRGKNLSKFQMRLMEYIRAVARDGRPPNGADSEIPDRFKS